MIIDKLLALREEFVKCDGKILRMTIDKNANTAFRNELPVPSACGTVVFGIKVDVVKECPTCGQNMENENGRRS